MRPSVKLLTTTQPVFEKENERINSSGYTVFDGTYEHSFLSKELDIIEYSGRWDYGPKSIAKMGDKGIIGRWIAAGHESMLEMVDATFFIECSRVVTHELVRHRIASYQQESQDLSNTTRKNREICSLYRKPMRTVECRGSICLHMKMPCGCIRCLDLTVFPRKTRDTSSLMRHGPVLLSK